MRMQTPTPTCSRWIEDSFLCDDTNIDDDDDNQFGTVDSVSACTPGETDTDTCGPYSVTSCPPSVGPDQDAFLTAPHMYAPASPFSVMSPDHSATEPRHPTDDVQYVSPAKTMNQMCEQVTRLKADPHATNVGRRRTLSGREDILKDVLDILDNNVTYSASKLKAFNEGFPQGIRRAVLFTICERLENSHGKQAVDTEPHDQRRMSLEEFIEIVPEEQLIRSLQDEPQISPRREDHTQIVKDSSASKSEAAANRNAKTPERPKTTNRARKRTANGLIFSNSDFSSFDNDIPVKRQMVVPSQTYLLPHFKDGQMYNTGSIATEMGGRTGRASVMCNSAMKKEEASSVGQNPFYGSPVSCRASLQQDTGQFGQAYQDPQISSPAAATAIIFTLDNNGNVVATDSQTTDSHVKPSDVDTTSNHKQYTACSARGLQTQQLTTSFTTPSLPDTAMSTIFLSPAAASSPCPPQQITHKLPDYDISTMRSIGVKRNSKNHNFSITNENRPRQQETATHLNTSPTGLVHQNLHPSCIHSPDIGACHRESTTSATTTTSFSFNDISQQQDKGTISHLFNPSASTNAFTAGTDLLPDTADPLLEEPNNSGILCLPVDAITAQVFLKSGSDSASLYHTPTLSNTTSAPETTASTDVLITPDDVVEALPGNSPFSTASASVFRYHGNDIIEDAPDCTNTDPGTSFWGSSTPDEFIQEWSGAVESKHGSYMHGPATYRDDCINGTPFKTKCEAHPTFTSAQDLALDTLSAFKHCHLISPSPCGSRYANGGTDYLTETNVDHLSASRNSTNEYHFSATKPQNRVFDVLLDDASQDSVNVFAHDTERHVPTDAASSVVDSGSTAVDPPGVTDSALVGVLRKSAETAQTSDVVKQGLKYAILTKRQKEGKADLDISFQPGGPHELTEEEQEKELRRKELNKKAAKNHRQKKKTSKETQDKEFEDLMKKNSQLKETVAQLQSEKERILNALQCKDSLPWAAERFLTVTHPHMNVEGYKIL